jgi:lipoate-protein ligase A
MNFCDLTLESPAENLACDEVLLDLCEAGIADEVLRVWEPPNYFVVLGYGNRAAAEANLPFCRQNTIPVYRRSTGGGTVLQGPGSLNYSLILRTDPLGPCHSIKSTNDFVMNRHRAALANLLKAPVEIRGHTDLAIGGLKFSGNAQRRKKDFLIFHGSFLLHSDIKLMEHALLLPARQPDYRLGRSHSDFLLNLKLKPSLLKATLQKAWRAADPLPLIPFDQIARLAQEKYNRHDWNFRF